MEGKAENPYVVCIVGLKGIKVQKERKEVTYVTIISLMMEEEFREQRNIFGKMVEIKINAGKQADLREVLLFIANVSTAWIARLVALGLDRNTRPYAAIQAISESFKILSTNIADRENREELKTIKAALDRLEGVNTVDIYAESES